MSEAQKEHFLTRIPSLAFVEDEKHVLRHRNLLTAHPADPVLEVLRRMTHANMSEEIDFFVRALGADLITPNDF